MVLLPLLAVAALTRAEAATGRGYFRTPSLRGGTIIFAAEGDLWRAGVRGGAATRLTTHPSTERVPLLSPDGKTVVFAAAYEGPSERYAMPVDGGEPTRLTFGASGGAVGWTPDGKLLYRTSGYKTLPDTQLVALDTATKRRTRLPLSQASDGVYDDAGNLYFTRFE